MTNLTKAQHFEAMALPHLNAAFNLARWLTRSNQDAEDVVQDAYLKAYKYFDHFRGGDGRTWLLAIVRNTFYTAYRNRQDHPQSEEFDEESYALNAVEALAQQGTNNPETVFARRDDQRQVHLALERLPVEFREVLILRELDDLSYRQIADITGIPIGTVMSRLSRGRKLLAQVLLHTDQEAAWTANK